MKTKISLWSTLLMTLIQFNLFSQVPTEEWDSDLGGNSDESGTGFPARIVKQCSDGGYIVGGSSNSAISGDKTQAIQGGYDYWVVKTNDIGEKQWDARFGGSGDDFIKVVEETDGGGYILGGESYSGASGDRSQDNYGGNSSEGGNSDFWVVRIDNAGVKIWDVRLGGSGGDRLYALHQTADHGYILGGQSFIISSTLGDHTDPGQGGWDFWMVKIDSSGVKQWDKRFGGTAHDQAFDLITTSNDGYLIGGNSYSGIDGDRSQDSRGASDYWVVKVDASGTKQWDARFGGTEADELHSLIETSEGNYLLGGYTPSGMGGDVSQNAVGIFDYWIVEISSDGSKLFDARFGSLGSCCGGSGGAQSLLQTVLEAPDGGFLLGGYSDGTVSGDKSEACGGGDFWIIKVNSIGIKEWDADWGGNVTDNFVSLESTNDGGYILAGYSNSPISCKKTKVNKGDYDLWMVKLSCESTLTWYLDSDGDGFGDPAYSVVSCTKPDEGYVLNADDCDDAVVMYQDADGDGYGYVSYNVNNYVPPVACDGVLNANDCGFDNNASQHPGATESCNSIDDNCNGLVDDIVATITPSGTVTTCSPISVALTANPIQGASYQWVRNNSNIANATGQTYVATKAAKYSVKITGGQCSATSPKTTIAVNTSPTATVTQAPCANGKVLLTCTANPTTGIAFQWKKGTKNVMGATSATYKTNKNGTYKCMVTIIATGCTGTSNSTTVTINCEQPRKEFGVVGNELSVYPNPGSGNFTLEYTVPFDESIAIKVYDVLGRQVFSSHEEVTAGIYTRQLDLSNLPSGTYYLNVIHDGASEMRKVVIEK